MDFASIPLNDSLFAWMQIQDFELQHIEFRNSELWKTKFVELRRVLEGDPQDKSNEILNCWASLPDKFICLKKWHLQCFQHSDHPICVSKIFPI